MAEQPGLEHARALRPRVRCTYCHDALERGEAVHCASCLAPHHADCHGAHGRCAAPGCDDPRALVPDVTGVVRPAQAARRPRGGDEATAKRLGGNPAKPARVLLRRTTVGRPARPAKGEGIDRRRRAGVATLVLVLALVALSWATWPDEVAPAPVIAARPAAPARVEVTPVTPPPAARVVVLERVSREVALVARDFKLPVSLARGELLVVQADERGYAHVVLERAGAAPETRFVAEPGDPIEVVTGARGARERLRAGPGEVIELTSTHDRGDRGQVRVRVVRQGS